MDFSRIQRFAKPSRRFASSGNIAVVCFRGLLGSDCYGSYKQERTHELLLQAVGVLVPSRTVLDAGAPVGAVSVALAVTARGDPGGSDGTRDIDRARSSANRVQASTNVDFGKGLQPHVDFPNQLLRFAI